MKSLSNLLGLLGFTNECVENDKTVRFHGVLYNNDLNDKLIKLKTDLEKESLGSLSLETDVGPVEITNNFQSVHEGKVTVVIGKTGNLYFITENGFADFLAENNSIPTEYPIKLYFITSPFESNACRFAPFDKTVSLSERKSPLTELKPNKFTKALDEMSQKLLPVAISQWVTLEYYLGSCPQSWKIESTKKLISCLGTELSYKDEVLEIEFKGDRRKSINLDFTKEELLNTVFNITNRTCDWIFLQNRDVDTKHTLFNQQIVFLLEDEKRDYPELLRILNTVFENTKSVYQYFLLNTSKEVQKNLSDLNRTLFDYISKLRQGTTDLSTSLWRDFAIVLGLMIINFSPKSPDVFKNYFSWFAIGLCLYIAVSFIMSSLSCFWFYYGLRDNLAEWRSKLYSYLTDHEFNDLALNPLKNSFRRFRITFFIVMFFYFLLLTSIILLIIFNEKNT